MLKVNQLRNWSPPLFGFGPKDKRAVRGTRWTLASGPEAKHANEVLTFARDKETERRGELEVRLNNK